MFTYFEYEVARGAGEKRNEKTAEQCYGTASPGTPSVIVLWKSGAHETDTETNHFSSQLK